MQKKRKVSQRKKSNHVFFILRDELCGLINKCEKPFLYKFSEDLHERKILKVLETFETELVLTIISLNLNLQKIFRNPQNCLESFQMYLDIMRNILKDSKLFKKFGIHQTVFTGIALFNKKQCNIIHWILQNTQQLSS